MAEPAATIPAPAAPPAAPPAPAPSPSGAPAPSATPQPPPKPGSAKARMFGELQKFADKKEAEPKGAPAKAPDKTTDKTSPAPAPGAEDHPTPEEDASPANRDKPADKKRTNPWDLYKQEKEAKKALETRIAELEGKVMKPEQQKEWESNTARLKELEDEIRFTNYTKSQEFKEKYQEPYDKAWKRAMGDLSELRVPDGDGGERPMQANDLLDIVNMPLQEARKAAVERFGDFADDAMQHRKEIRRLYDEQSAAIETAKKDGETREKAQREQQMAKLQGFNKEVQETWNKANEEAKGDEKYGKFFQPKEGDQEWNQRLAKGFELADRAFSENPMIAKDSDERRSIVQRHAAVRNRAAAFGALVNANNQLESRIADLAAKLAKYEGTEPSAGGSAPAKTPSQPASAWGRMRSELEKIAK